ncbi:hypothetical protein [Roseivirga sp.]|uniref:spermine/spermidine synthase domain-containing protein n=1 Tax=Roseivirga sp. TaxID=1964215 RepID=UPI003B8C37BB
MSNFFKGYVIIIGWCIVGYCLAYPMLLANYFYEKPLIDISGYVLIFISALLLTRKFLKELAGLKYLVFALIILPLAWLKLDYWLYSTIDAPQFVLYLEVFTLGISAYALFKYPIVPNATKWTYFILVPFFMAGFLLSFLSKEHSLSELLVLFFVTGLIASHWKEQRVLSLLSGLAVIILLIGANYFDPPKFFETQSNFHDKVVYSYTTDLQRVDVTEWKGDHWFYTDGINQFSSIDAWLFYEPFAYPVLKLVPETDNILVVGGENGMLINELFKAGLSNIDQVPIDEELLQIAREEELFLRYNNDNKTQGMSQMISDNIFDYLNANLKKYDLIFLDVADPIDIERNQFFTKEFYDLIGARLTPKGAMVTQSGSPYFATEAYDIVLKTMSASGFNVTSFHNQVLTLGEWSWAIGSLNLSATEMKNRLTESKFNEYPTRWLNQEAMQMMLSFGKPSRKTGEFKVNTIKAPLLYKYYLNGNYTFK